MPMPEAAMYEDDRAEPSKDDVRPARESLYMHAESKTHSVKQRADNFLWFRILTWDTAHVPAAMLFA
jgi:hypothetical protein